MICTLPYGLYLLNYLLLHEYNIGSKHVVKILRWLNFIRLNELYVDVVMVLYYFKEADGGVNG
jgi:hypothetical protein